MKQISILLFLLIAGLTCNSQIVPSSCYAPDSIVAQYRNDADRLALQIIFENNLTFVDSVDIPQNLSDTILKALIAVYNATALPAIDTVVSMFDIHSFPIPDLNYIVVGADSSLTWMQQLKNGIVPTGEETIDNLLILYNLNIFDYYTHQGYVYYHTVEFKSDSNYNTQAITELFEAIPGVVYANPSSHTAGDGNDITAAIYPEYVKIIYSRGWGDCYVGCIYGRFWEFNVYYDCSVEFVGSFGDILPLTTVNENNKDRITISPNPFKADFQIKDIKIPFNYIISNSLGQILMSGQSLKSNIDNLHILPSGVYFLTIRSTWQNETIKIIKE